MDEPKLVMPEKKAGKGKAPLAAIPGQSWAILGWLGIVFLVVGGSDFALTWYPASFGNHEWEFGTVTASFNGLPIVVMGVALVLAAALQTGRRWLLALGTIVAVVMCLWILMGAALWATNVPLALKSVPEGVVLGMKKSLSKTLVQSATYPIAFAYLAVRGFRSFRGG